MSLGTKKRKPTQPRIAAAVGIASNKLADEDAYTRAVRDLIEKHEVSPDDADAIRARLAKTKQRLDDAARAVGNLGWPGRPPGKMKAEIAKQIADVERLMKQQPNAKPTTLARSLGLDKARADHIVRYLNRRKK